VKGLGKHLNSKSGEVIASQLIQHTLSEARKSSLPVIPFFTDQQQGTSFADRFNHAIENAFALGFDRLIICGTDSPNINRNQFNQVVQKLNGHQLVLGPSADGGVYLIGIHKEAYQKEAFAQITWLTDTVFSQLKLYALQLSLSFAVEEEGYDIDDANALYQEKEQPESWFSLFVSQLVSSFKKVKYYLKDFSFHDHYIIAVTALRGPPQTSL
jgi:uncharacterized protein